MGGGEAEPNKLVVNNSATATSSLRAPFVNKQQHLSWENLHHVCREGREAASHLLEETGCHLRFVLGGAALDPR